MTLREKLKKEHPEYINPDAPGGCDGCPSNFGYDSEDNEEKNCITNGGYGCECCWDREMSEENTLVKPGLKYQERINTRNDVRKLFERVSLDKKVRYYRGYTDTCSYGWDSAAWDYIKKEGEYWFENPGYDPNYIPDVDKPRIVGPTVADVAIAEMEADIPRILDSDNRRQFETGAVRDIHDGKGRCDLLPLDVVGHALANPTLCYIYKFQLHNDTNALYDALSSCGIFHDYYTLMLEVAKHFEEGCKKYGDNNWQKGIPTHCYIDSAVRHYLKYLRGDRDEPHDRAFCWNILCCIWTCIHKPELNDYKPKENNDADSAEN